MLEEDCCMIDNEVIRNILKRRTIRRFKKEQIGREELETILSAGLHAPSAGGRQGESYSLMAPQWGQTPLL